MNPGGGGGRGSKLECLICDFFYLGGVWGVGGRGLCFGMPNLWIYSPLSGMGGGGGALHWDALSVNPMSGGGGGGARNWNALSAISFYLGGVWGVGGRGLCFGMPNLWNFFFTSEWLGGGGWGGGLCLICESFERGWGW